MSEDLKISIIGSLNKTKTTQEIKEQLKEIEGKLNVEIGVEANVVDKLKKELDLLKKTVNDHTKKIKVIDDDEALKGINTAKQGVKELYSDIDKAVKHYSKFGQVKVDKNLDPVTKDVDQFTLAVTKANGVVEKLKFSLAGMETDSGLKKIYERTNVKVTDNTQSLREKVLQDEQKIERQIEKQNDDLEKQIELYKRRSLIDIQTLRSKHKNTIDHQGLNELEKSVLSLEKSTPNVTRQMNHLSLDLKELKGHASEAARSSMSFADSMRTAFQKFPVWLLASTSIYGTIAATQNLLTVIIDVDTAMTNLRKVMSQDTNFDKVFDSATDSAERFAKTITETLAAYETFAKQGYKGDDLQFLGDAGLVASNVGEIDTTAASEYLTSALVQWNKETKEAMGIVDSWNELSNDYATTVEKLAQGHGRAASTARNMGLSFDQTNAIIGSLTASTKQSGREIGNFLKNVLPRLTSQPAQDALDMVGVNLLDDSGNMRNVVDVYTEVAKQVKDMDAYNRSIVTEGLAGKYHISRMDALLNDLSSGQSMYRSMVESSENSLGSASAENEKYMQSLQARAQETRLEFEKMALALGESFLTEAFIQTLKGLNQLMGTVIKLTDGLGGLPLILGVVGLGFGSLSKNLNGFARGLMFSVEKMSAAEKASLGLSSGMTKAEIATTGLGKAFRGFLASTAVGVGFLVLGLALEKFLSKMGETRKAQEELEQKNNELMASYKQSKGEIASLTSEYERLEQVINSGKYTNDDLERYKEIQNSLAQNIPSLVIGEDQYGNKVLASADSVKAKVEMLERQLAVQEKLDAIEEKEQAQESYDAAKKSLEEYEKNLDRVIDKTNRTLNGANGVGTQGAIQSKKSIDDFDDLIAKIEELEKKDLAGTINANEMFDLKTLTDAKEEYKKAGLMIDTAKMTMVSNNNQLIKSSLAANDSISDSAKSMINDFSLFASSASESSEKVDDVLSSIGDKANADSKFRKTFEDYGKAIDEYKDKVNSGMSPENLIEYRDKAVNSFNAVKKELLDVAKTSGYSGDSIQSLEARLGILANSSFITSESLDSLSQSTGKSKEQLMAELLLVPELAGEMENLAFSADNASESKWEMVDASYAVAGRTSQEISQIENAIMTLEMLKNQHHLTADQQKLQASAVKYLSDMFPHLNGQIVDNIEAMKAETRAMMIMNDASATTADIQMANEYLKTDAVIESIEVRIAAYNREMEALEALVRGQEGIIPDNELLRMYSRIEYLDESLDDLQVQRREAIQNRDDLSQYFNDLDYGFGYTSPSGSSGGSSGSGGTSDAERAAEEAAKQKEQAIQDIINLYKQGYEKQQEIALSALEAEKKAFENAHQAKIDKLDEELSKYEEIINAQLEMIDNEKQEEDYNKQLAKEQEKLREIQSSISDLALDDSFSAQKQRSELNKQLQEQQEVISNMQRDKQIEDRKNNLQQLLENKQSQTESTKNAEQANYDKAIIDFENQEKSLQRMFENLINDQRKFAVVKRDINAGNTSAVIADLDKIFVDVSANRSVIGESIAIGILDSITRAKKMLTSGSYSDSVFQSFDTGGLTGSWGKQGKLAMLHEKEIVLNQKDTPNLLKAVEFTRDIVGKLNLPKLPSLMPKPSVAGGTGDFSVNFYIEEFNGTQQEMDSLFSKAYKSFKLNGGSKR